RADLLGELGDRLDGTHLILRQNDCTQTQRTRRHGLGSDPPARIDAQTVNSPALLLEAPDWFNGCWMLDHGGNCAVLGSNLCCSADRKVVCFGAAGSKGDFIRMRINEAATCSRACSTA